MSESVAETDALLLGRKTYQIHAAYWPTAPADDPFAQKFNSIPKYVVSTTLDKAEWKNSTLIKSNVPQEVTRLKQQPGPGIISVTGSGRLAETLMKHNLVDEYVLWINPIVLGSGKRLFDGGVTPSNLKLIDTKTTSSGVLVLTYQPDNK
jgi:dihydrofolate reductase